VFRILYRVHFAQIVSPPILKIENIFWRENRGTERSVPSTRNAGLPSIAFALPNGPQIDPFQEQCQPGPVEHPTPRPVGRVDRLEGSRLQPLVPQAVTRLVPEQNFAPVPGAIEEHEQMSAERILVQDRLHMTGQPIKSAPHVQGVGGHKDPYRTGPVQHSVVARAAARISVRIDRSTGPVSRITGAGPQSTSRVAVEDGTAGVTSTNEEAGTPPLDRRKPFGRGRREPGGIRRRDCHW